MTLCPVKCFVVVFDCSFNGHGEDGHNSEGKIVACSKLIRVGYDGANNVGGSYLVISSGGEWVASFPFFFKEFLENNFLLYLSFSFFERKRCEWHLGQRVKLLLELW